MKARGFLLLALLGALAASAADRELNGRLVDANTGEPVARAHVNVRFLQGAQPAAEVTTLTDADGAFKITNLPDGQIQLTCDKAGYLSASQVMAAMPPGNPTGAKSASAITLRMTAQAAVEGTVMDDRDLPAAGTFVQLVRQQVLNGRRQFQPAGGAATDETGSFRVFGLPAGRYYISIAAKLSGSRRRKPLAYPRLYYPNATDIGAAQPIELKAGDEAEIKIRLPEPVPAFEIRGVVATTASNIGVGLLRQPANQPFQGSDGDLDWDEKTKVFRYSHVTPGIYIVSANVPDGRTSLHASATVTVGSADVTGIRLEPAESALDGTVRTDGDGPPVRPFVSVQSANYGNGAPADADGKFHIPSVPPGNYRLTVQTGQACTRSMLQGSRDVRDGLTITAGMAPDPVDIVLTSHCGSVDVTFTPPDPSPPVLGVYLLHKGGEEIALERQGALNPRNADGAFHCLLQGIAPGDYTVYVWPMDAPIEYANPEFMKPLESFGQAVTVTEDGKASVTVDKILTIPAKN
jgi:hypothetical protein